MKASRLEQIQERIAECETARESTETEIRDLEEKLISGKVSLNSVNGKRAELRSLDETLVTLREAERAETLLVTANDEATRREKDVATMGKLAKAIVYELAAYHDGIHRANELITSLGTGLIVRKSSIGILRSQLRDLRNQYPDVDLHSLAELTPAEWRSTSESNFRAPVVPFTPVIADVEGRTVAKLDREQRYGTAA